MIETKDTFRLIMQYDGSKHCGWQIQPGRVSTIQGELHQALEKMFKSTDIKTWACGRTDAGVHALGQVVKLEVPQGMPVSALRPGLNAMLPEQIRVKSAEYCEANFHPVFDACWKTYYYYFSTSQFAPVLQDKITAIKFELDILAMQLASKYFCGVHDFKNFRTVGTEVKTTVREIYGISLEKCPLSEPMSLFCDNLYCLKVTGSGFLKQMVRLMAGALFEVGRGKIEAIEIKNALESELLARHLSAVASPHGLYQIEVGYSPWSN